MIIKHFLFFLLVTITSSSKAQNQEGLKKTIKNLLTEQKLTGAVWATVTDKGKVITDAYGYKNTKTKELLSQTDKVHVGSVSKTILAAGFLRMATLGLLNIDDPIQKYLPNLLVENRWYDTNPISVRHLLDHTSGLTDAKLWHIFSTTATPNTPLETAYLNSLNILKVQAKPGSIYSYSNLGYTILGMVIEKITKKKYENYLDDNFLKPLGMTNSSFEFISQTKDKKLAFGHFDDGKTVAAMSMYLRPAGQLTTTAEDVGKFLRFMMSDGTVDGKTFIDSEYLNAVGKQKLTDAFKNGVPFGDALGAYSRDRYGVVGIAKNGNILGFSAMTYMFPNYKKAFFIAFNMDSETANYDLFNEVLIKHLGLAEQHFITKELEIETDIEDWNGFYVPYITAVEPFRLIDMVFSHTKVKTSKTGALLIPFQGKNRTLIYQGEKKFSMKDRTNISHAFYKNSEGKLLITNGVNTLKKVSGFKILGIATSLLLGIFSLIYLFITGCINLIKYKFDFKNKPIFWVFTAILTLFISFAFIATNSFMNMGDLSFGNVLLALATLLIPLFSVVTLILITKKKKYTHTLSFWTTIFLIQFCVLLIANNLMPIIMWK